MTTPLLIIGDAPSATSGLGRICRDVATRVHAHLSDVFDVATLGYGGPGDRSLPFPQYAIEGLNDWFIPALPNIWENFAGGRRGVVMTIWDASRLLWFARPDNPQWCQDRNVRAWLTNPAPFQRWGYFPMDATGPHGKLSVMNKECLQGFNRVLAYSKWAATMIDGSNREPILGKEFLPHGIDTTVFRPHDRREARSVFTSELRFSGPKILPKERIIGIVATNQPRKDFGLAMEAIARIDKTIPVRIYIQTDTLERHWSIPALLMDYGLMAKAIVNCSPTSDTTTSKIYSACDLTLGIGLGEGFGYPIFESLACGTPVVTGTYGGHAEWLPPLMMVEPKAWRVEGVYNCVRPVFEPADWTHAMERLLKAEWDCGSMLPPQLDWESLWPKWEAWFRDGLDR